LTVQDQEASQTCNYSVDHGLSELKFSQNAGQLLRGVTT